MHRHVNNDFRLTSPAVSVAYPPDTKDQGDRPRVPERLMFGSGALRPRGLSKGHKSTPSCSPPVVEGKVGGTRHALVTKTTLRRVRVVSVHGISRV